MVLNTIAELKTTVLEFSNQKQPSVQETEQAKKPSFKHMATWAIWYNFRSNMPASIYSKGPYPTIG
jgi:hypothetical protein